MTLADIFWLATYGVALVGSVSFGYLSLRYSMPDIRTLPGQMKLGLAGLVGLIMFAIAAGASLFLGRVAVLALLPVLAAALMALLELRYHLMSATTMRVAVPVAVVAAPPMPSLEAPEKEKPSLLSGLLKRREAVRDESFGTPLPPVERPREKPKEKPVEKPMERPAPVIEKPPEPKEVTAPPAPASEKKSFFSFLHKEKKPAPIPEAPVEAPAEEPRVRRERYAERAAGREAGPQPEQMSERRRRYLAHRGELVDDVKADLAKPHELQAGAPGPAAEVSLEDITRGVDTSGLEQVGSLDELGSLTDTESLAKLGSELDASSIGGLAELQEIPKPKGAGCPRCSALHSTVVYCPYCGKGFCSNCSSKVHAKEDLVLYVCPLCTKEVIVKKEGP